MPQELQVADYPREEYDGYFEFADLGGDGHSNWRGRVVKRSTNGLYLETFGTKDEVQGRVRGAMEELRKGGSVVEVDSSPMQNMAKVLGELPPAPAPKKSLMQKLFGN